MPSSSVGSATSTGKVICCSTPRQGCDASRPAKSFRRCADEAFMLLAIDSGNTNAVFAVYDGDVLRASWRVSTNARRTADEYAVWLTQLMALAGLARTAIDATIIGNVVPEAGFNLLGLCRDYLDCEPLIVGTAACRLGIGVDVDMPAESVGADRVANAVAAGNRYRTPLIVVDFGTATNFDIIDG